MRTVLLGAMLILSGAAPLSADDGPPSASILQAKPPALAEDVLPVYPSTVPPGKPVHGKGVYQSVPYVPGGTYVVPSTPTPSVAPLPSTTSPSYDVPVPYTPPSAAYSPYAKPRKADHLRSAAEHLEAAGEKETAARVRQLLGDELVRQNNELLKQKEAQLRRLQEEIERLRAAAGSPRQIMLEVKVYEVSLTKMQTLGVDFRHYFGVQADEKNGAAGIHSNLARVFDLQADETNASLAYYAFDKDHPFWAILNALEADNLARLVGQTCVVGALGAPARYAVAHPSGRTTDVEFTPRRLSDERLRLDFRIKLSEQTERLGPDENGQPRVSVREAATGGEFANGQMLVLAGLKQVRTAVEVNRDTDPLTKRTRTNSYVTVFVIHPQVLDGAADSLEPAAAVAAPVRE